MNQKLRGILLDKVIWISILIVAFLAWQDVTGSKMWKSIGGWAGEAYTKASPIYMQQFWVFAYALIIVVALVYYLYTKDKSEAAALVAIPVILLQSGWEDIMYYAMGGHQFVGTTMPWLWDNCPFMRWVAMAMGETTVTANSLLVSAGVGAVIAYFVYKYLKKAHW